ncbi:MAG: REP-associated tyrosine transposase [Phycisphaerales bacterium JB063]
MNEPKLTRTRRHLPHWDLPGSTYFVTFRVDRGRMSESEQRLVLDHIASGDGKFYRLVAAVVMPDHVHLIFQPRDEYSLSRVMKGIKGVSAKLVNAARSTRGTFWQDEYHDRILRSEDELIEKAGYLLANPARAGLVKPGEPYPYVVDHLDREG